MNRKEFLDELENALTGRMSEGDVREVLSDYGDIFAQGREDGRTDDTISAEIGSPARIARKILEECPDFEGNARQYTEFQKNINEKTSRIFDRMVEPDRSVDAAQLASMGRRLGAYIIDGLCLGVVGIGLMLAMFAPVFFTRFLNMDTMYNFLPQEMGMGKVMMIGNAFPRFFSMNIVMLITLLGFSNLFTTIILWATNGYSPGKWLLGLRVVKLNGEKVTFVDALLRELIIKGIANSILSGILNVISFVWGCVTEDRKTVHDLAAQTRVLKIDRYSGRNQRY